MKRYITIDGGTTNTRIYLVEDCQITDTVKINVGSNSPDSKVRLSAEIKDKLQSLLDSHSLSDADIHRIIASGMITSEFGLLKLDHAIAPVGIDKLHDAMVEVELPDISSVPFVFLRGIKTVGDKLFDFNMMRGEETELMGIAKAEYGSCIYVLPGSHSKIIRINENGEIFEFISTLTGEMIAALTKGTILSTCVDLNSTLCDEGLFEGYDYAYEYGINEALLKTRTLANIMKKDNDYLYSFFLGVVLCDEIKAIIKMEEKTVVISGREEIKRAIATLLEKYSDKEVIALDKTLVDSSTVRGAIKIYEYNK
jgi:2-dehydro-3-deoxygalactonokinase